MDERNSSVAQCWEKLELAPFLPWLWDSQNGSILLTNHALMMNEYYTPEISEKEEEKSIPGQGDSIGKGSVAAESRFT